MTDTAAPCAPDGFAAARSVADAVLFEGYVLYPYRASSAKNRMRWQFGVLVPPAWAESDGGGDRTFQRTECLMEPRRGAVLRVQLRFLRLRRRSVERRLPDGTFEETDSLELPDRTLVPWDEGAEECVTAQVPAAELPGAGLSVPFTLPAGEETEEVHDAAGRVTGRSVRRCAPVHGRLRLTASGLPGPYRVFRLRAVVENTSPWTGTGCGRDAALPHALISAHLLLGLSSGVFLSMTDPPEWARAAVAECSNLHTWPVLAGDGEGAGTVLSSPIILEDHPRIAPESPGTLYDATEIDEILTLRTAALSDAEKREARGTDDRAAAVIELADSMPQEVLERLHGAVRGLREVTEPSATERPATEPSATEPSVAEPAQAGVSGRRPAGSAGPSADPTAAPATPWWDPASDEGHDPAHNTVAVDGVPVRAGSRVVLRPGRRRTDAQDAFVHGRGAVVEGVLHDVDGGVHVAVTVDGDPGADIRREQGRFLYFQPDELEPAPQRSRLREGSA